jgi:hypothetical protein
MGNKHVSPLKSSGGSMEDIQMGALKQACGILKCSTWGISRVLEKINLWRVPVGYLKSHAGALEGAATEEIAGMADTNAHGTIASLRAYLAPKHQL